MAKHQTGTIQEILARHYTECKEQNRLPDIWRRTESTIKRRIRHRDRMNPKDSELLRMLRAQYIDPERNKRGPMHFKFADRKAIRERQKADIARWRAKNPD